MPEDIITYERALRILNDEELKANNEQIDTACHIACAAIAAIYDGPAAQKAIQVLHTGHRIPNIPHTVDDLDAACQLARDAIREIIKNLPQKRSPSC